ncbi:hypothetical protein [Archangium lansingense]|uniref:RNA polymerase sigma-70 region 2 domain-containing protein n=1 Tax=Archangium lansingense TaxID=2995310 RepID=A0ABT4AF50_9BACT|nr:hypothetical protein [Archangium lansinium]MCY1080309.1 hypothetical protein [Archangium lansinium]
MQEPFPFLSEVPTHQTRREERARRPHLRRRTQPGADLRQQVLPFRRTGRESILTPELAEAMETALAEVRGAAEGGLRQRNAEARLLELLTPFLRAEVEHAFTHHERTHLDKEDLLQEARLRAQRLWKRFTPGWAGPGRTLYPAYVQKAVRQRLGNVLEEAKLVGPTQWGRKLAGRARRRVARGESSYEDALRKEGADHATTLGLTLGATRASELEALQLADEGEEGRTRRALHVAAAAALKQLPRLERLAVAVPMGLTRETLTDAQLARRLKCTPEELLAARARGLATLREYMHGREA